MPHLPGTFISTEATAAWLWAACSRPTVRAVHPVTTPAASFDAALRGATLVSFQGLSPNGEWTLFLADLSLGQESTLVSWGLDLVTIPEPAAWMACLVGFALLGLRKLRLR